MAYLGGPWPPWTKKSVSDMGKNWKTWFGPLLCKWPEKIWPLYEILNTALISRMQIIMVKPIENFPSISGRNIIFFPRLWSIKFLTIQVMQHSKDSQSQLVSRATIFKFAAQSRLILRYSRFCKLCVPPHFDNGSAAAVYFNKRQLITILVITFNYYYNCGYYFLETNPLLWNSLTSIQG